MPRPIALVLAVGALATAAPPAVGGDGALLFHELGCANCHGGRSVAVPRSGPNLAGLARRVDHRWVLAFLADPQHGRMPRLFEALPEAGRAGAIQDVAAWLGTLGDGPTFRQDRHANAERGAALFREVGCLACHAPGGEPLPDSRSKTSLQALTHFLEHANDYRPDGRMPQVVLERQEAIDIAAHLLDFQDSDPRNAPAVAPWPTADLASIERGRAHVESLDCAACHALPGLGAPPVRPIMEAAGGCWQGEGPARYTLSDEQRSALAAYLAAPAPDEPGATQTLAALNCLACHERDGAGGPSAETAPSFTGDEALGDAGRLPPPLTGVGRKLQAAWMEGVLLGDVSKRVRPYLNARMPRYPPPVVAALSRLLRSADAALPPLPPMAKVDDLAAGRKLLGIDGGVQCITCHGWGDKASLGIRGMDISALDERLRPDWFRAFLLDPASSRPGTLMPPLWPGGQATVNDVLDGDAERQIGAIWAFIRDGEGVPDGFPAHSAGQFELVPTDRPILQRTFLEGVGTKAIVVGFPGGTNLAYDAAAAAPALVWRGRFVDAYGTWFSRFAPFAEPLVATTFRFGAPVGKSRFLGYELDAGGNPTFLSRTGDIQIFDRYTTGEAGALVRSVHWVPDATGAAPAITHPEGLSVVAVPGEGTATMTYSWP